MIMNSGLNIKSLVCSATSKIVAVTFAALIAVSCSDNTFDEVDSAGDIGYINLNLSTSSVMSRETESDDLGNENLISDALICIFPVGASSDEDVPVVMQSVNVGKRTEASVMIQLSRDLIKNIFPDNINKAIVHVFANLPDDTKAQIGSSPTLGQLKRLSIKSDFASYLRPQSFVMFGDAEIDYIKDIDNTGKDQVEGTVRLNRSAAKISLNVKIADTVTDDAGREWAPVIDKGMSALITNGVDGSSVVPSTYILQPDDYYSTSTASSNEYHRERSFTKLEGELEYPYTLNWPFYTYPNKWNVESESETMTYMTLIVPWQSEGSYRTCFYMVPVVRDVTEIVNNVSYRVNINVNILGSTKPDEPLELEDVSYRAVDWGKESFDVNIDDYRYLVVDNNTYTLNNEGQISIPFYSSHETVIKYELDTLNYYLYNTTAAGLEKTMAVNNTIRNNSTTAILPDSTGTSVKMFSDWIDNKVDETTNSRTLHFHHELYQWTPQKSVAGGGYTDLAAGTNRNPTAYGSGFGPYTTEAYANGQLNSISRYILTNLDTPAFSRYRMTITIVHKDKIGEPDEAQYTEKFVIWQYPAMYIESTQNFYSETSNDNTAVRGNVWVNANQSTNNTAWVTVRGLQGGNKNPNQYIVNITSFSNTSYYIIGDPRVIAVDNLTTNFTGNAPANGWATAPGIENADTDNPTSTRKLTWYYPSDESNTRAYYVAPTFRIASSYGVCGSAIDYQGAKRRCASYQELEYPAGRWRIPTLGELEFILTLSNTGKIPVLINSGSTYWTAQGAVTTTLNNGKLTAPTNTTRTAYVRCVYDEWYWEGSTIKTTQTQTYQNETFSEYPFVWGDAKR